MYPFSSELAEDTILSGNAGYNRSSSCVNTSIVLNGDESHE